MSDLVNQKCVPCEGGVTPLNKESAKKLLQKIPGWSLNDEGTVIAKKWIFKGFYKTMFFVNAVAAISQKEGHHPDLKVGYNYCEINFTTHAINGLSDNDFICAAKIEALVL